MSMEKLQFKYDALSAWIERADTKASILLGVQLFILGFVLQYAVSNFSTHWLAIVVYLVFVITSVASLLFLYQIVGGRLDNETRDSRIYFRDIAENADQRDDYIDILSNETDEEYKRDLSAQIVALAKVANSKYEKLSKVGLWMALSFSSGFIIYAMEILKDTVK